MFMVSLLFTPALSMQKLNCIRFSNSKFNFVLVFNFVVFQNLTLFLSVLNVLPEDRGPVIDTPSGLVLLQEETKL